MATERATAAEFTRLAKCLAGRQNAGYGDALMRAEAERASPRVLEVLKAASPAAALGDPEWAGSLAAYDGLSRGFIESLRSRSLFYAFAPRGNLMPLRTRIVATAALPVTGAVAEGAWLPVTTGGWAASTLEPTQAGGIVVMTRDLVRAMDAESFAVLRRELQKAAVASVDDAFLAIALDEVTPQAATEDPLADLRKMLNVVNTTGAGELMLMLAPDVANAASTVGIAGLLFPEMSPRGGRMLGIDAMVSDRLSPGRIVMADALGFSVNEGAIAVDRSEGAALKMMDNPGDTAGELVSMFQTDSVALRVVARFGVERVRAGSVAVLDDAAAAWAQEAAS